MRKIFILFLLISTLSFSQKSRFGLPFFNLQSLSGELQFDADYNYNESNYQNTNDFRYGPGLKFKSQSYIYHPNLLTLSISGKYNPSFENLKGSELPSTLSKDYSTNYDIRASFFKRLQTNFTAFNSYNEYYSNNSEFSVRRKKDKNWGGQIQHQSKSASLNFKFEKSDETQLDLINNRNYKQLKTSYFGDFEKSFFGFDSNELLFSWIDYASEQDDFFKNSNTSKSLMYTNFSSFGKEKKDRLRSHLYLRELDAGQNQNNLSIGVNEGLLLNLSKSLLLRSDFNFDKSKKSSDIIETSNVSGSLRHLFYESLISEIFVDQKRVNNYTNFQLNNFSKGFSTAYRKKIPIIKGDIRISYNYSKFTQEKIGSNNEQSVYNEEYILEDGNIVILQDSNIILESIVVKSELGDFIYQENIDYVLIQSGNIIEIQRLIGGNIENNSPVYLDYIKTLNNTYSYNGNNKYFKSELIIAKNLVNLYFSNSSRVFNSVDDISFLNLDKFSKNSFGSIFNYKTLRAEIKYEENISSLIAYKLWNYSLNMNGYINNKLNFVLNGNIFNYTEYFSSDTPKNKFTLSSNLNYRLTYDSQLSFKINYFEQNSSNQKTELIVLGSNYIKQLNQVNINLGVVLFKKSSQQDPEKYLGANIRILRRF